MTRRAAPETRPVVLTVAGSDSGGGAGIQADLKTIEACGGFGTSAITSVTAQNTAGVESTHVLPTAEIEAQCEAVLSDFDVAAVKTGMLATADVVELVTDQVQDLAAPTVVDPVMVAASGDRLLAREAESAYEKLVAASTLVTPNADEAAVLTGIDPQNERETREAGEALLDLGADAALVKGGHVPGEDVVDVLVTDDSVETFRHPRVETDATHGSGCTLSSAIATHLARGSDLTEAVGAGIDLLGRAVRYNLDVGHGPGAVHHLVEIRNDAARNDTAEAVESTVAALLDEDIAPLVPTVGTNVAGATPYAERPDEVAAVEGRITRTPSGAEPNRGVRFGASAHVAAAVLGAREVDAAVRFGVNYRYDDAMETALEGTGISVASFARGDERDRSHEESPNGAAIRRGVERAFAEADQTPAAVVDRTAPGEELVYLLAADGDELVAGTREILDEVAE